MRILLAPTEVAGTMGATARALRNLGLKAVSCNLKYKQNSFGYVCDIDFGPQDIPASITKKVSKFFFICTSFFRFDVFHFYFGRTNPIPKTKGQWSSPGEGDAIHWPQKVEVWDYPGFSGA